MPLEELYKLHLFTFGQTHVVWLITVYIEYSFYRMVFLGRVISGMGIGYEHFLLIFACTYDCVFSIIIFFCIIIGVCCKFPHSTLQRLHQRRNVES